MMKKLLVLLLCLFGLNIAYAANCTGEFDPVSGSCRIIGSDGRQIIYNSDPPQSAQTLPKKVINTTIIHKASKYGAFALNEKTGISAGAINMPSKAEAQREAIKQCEDGGRNAPCSVVKWIRNGCIAGAKGYSGKFSRAFFSGGKPGQAETIALKMCKKAGVAQCEIFIPEACSVPEGMYN